MYPKMMVNEGIAYGELLERLIESAAGAGEPPQA